MAKIKNLFKVTKQEAAELAMIAGGSVLLSVALQRSGGRNVIDYIRKHGLKVIDATGKEVTLGLKPLIHID